jgi:uncharacterized membrane protein YjgN (DUF898 family)
MDQDPITAAGTAGTRIHPLEFRGSGAEYFRIWIVNLALTILTLGIYSAWAKVRRLRYMHGSTWLDGSSFGYHGEPLRILKGRAIAFVLVAAYFGLGQLSPVAGAIAGLVLFAVFPWLIVKSMVFRLRMTSWRGVRFDFRSDFAGAYKTFMGWAVLAAVTFGILFPRFAYERHRYVVTRASFGSTPFAFAARVWPFYRTYMIASVIVLAVLALVIGAAFAAARGGAGLQDPATLAMLQLLPLLAILVSYLAVAGYLQARILNEVYGSTSLGLHRLHSTLEALPLTWIYASNVAGVLLTLGLFTPWAQVRLARYRLGTLGVEAQGSLAEFAAAQERSQPGAAGEEISDFFDVDFGL